MSEETRQLAEYVFDLQSADLPTEIRDRLHCFVIDNIAAGILGSQQTSFQIAAGVQLALGGVSESHIFRHATCLDSARASLVNGVAIGAFEIEQYGNGHASATVFPAILALGEALGVSGATFLKAMAAGYEVNTRVAKAQTGLAERVRGFHSPAICSVFGAASGCAVILGLSVEQTLAALGIAGSHACGLIEFVWTGSMTKRLHLGRASQMGLEAALLAQNGFTGPPTILEGQYGYLQAYSPEPNVAALVDSLGSRWFMNNTQIKLYPGHGTLQPFIPVLDEWRNREGVASNIERVTLRVSDDMAEDRHLDRNPGSIMGAQYSVPFMTALVLARGTDGPIDLNEKSLEDPQVLELAKRIAVEHDTRFDGATSGIVGEITIDTNRSSETLVASALTPHPTGELDRICRNKLSRYASNLIAKESVLEIEAMIDGLDGLSDIGDLARFLDY